MFPCLPNSFGVCFFKTLVNCAARESQVLGRTVKKSKTLYCEFMVRVRVSKSCTVVRMQVIYSKGKSTFVTSKNTVIVTCINKNFSKIKHTLSKTISHQRKNYSLWARLHLVKGINAVYMVHTKLILHLYNTRRISVPEPDRLLYTYKP